MLTLEHGGLETEVECETEGA